MEEEVSTPLPLSTTTPSNARRRRILDGEIYQLFSLPDSIIYYIAMNPANAEVYKKLIRTCKYFYNINPIMVVHELRFNEHEDDFEYDEKDDLDGHVWKASFKKFDVDSTHKIDVDMLPCKLWITDVFYLCVMDISGEKLAAAILPKIYQCNASWVNLDNQVLTLDEFLLLGANAKRFDLCFTTITENDGTTLVMFERIIQKLPKIETLDWGCSRDCKYFSSDTVKELLKIQHFGNITSLFMYYLPEIFNAKDLFDSLKTEYRNMKVDLMYHGNKSNEYSDQFKRQMDQIVDEIIATEVFDYKPPNIDYNPAQDMNKHKQLLTIFNCHSGGTYLF